MCASGGGEGWAFSTCVTMRRRLPLPAPPGLGRHGQGMTLVAVALLSVCFIQGSSSGQHGPPQRRCGHHCSSPARAAWAAPRLVQVGWLPRVRRGSVHQQGCCAWLPRAVRPRRAVLSMKARGKRGRSGAGGGATATAGGRGGGGGGGGTKQQKKKKSSKALYIQIEDLESDSWR